MVRRQAQHRRPRPYSPVKGDLAWMAVLAFFSGLLLGIAQEAMEENNYGWAIFFLMTTIAATVLYFWTARDLVRWKTGYRPSEPVDPEQHRPVTWQRESRRRRR